MDAENTPAVGKCEHKEIDPLNKMEIFGCVVTFVGLLTSNMGGLGGGGVIIPVAMVFFGFNTKQAIAQSNASIFVSSVARYLFNFNQSHPYKNGRGILVDYNIASLMLPMITVGASVGSIVNKILPSFMIAILLTVLLIFVGFTTLRKLLKIIAQERVQYGPLCGGTKPADPSPEVQMAPIDRTNTSMSVIQELNTSKIHAEYNLPKE